MELMQAQARCQLMHVSSELQERTFFKMIETHLRLRASPIGTQAVENVSGGQLLPRGSVDRLVDQIHQSAIGCVVANLASFHGCWGSIGHARANAVTAGLLRWGIRPME